MSIIDFILLVIGGIAAGGINTLAGNGSAITLMLLETMGLPITIANGTNRVGVLFQSIIAVGTFQQSGKLEKALTESKWLIIPIVGSALIGAYCASILSNEEMKAVVKWLMLVLLIVILLKPKRWLRETAVSINRKTVLNYLLFIGVGFYAGFIQMGMGVIFLAVMVLAAKYSLIDSNIIKVLVVLLLTIPVLILFVWQGQVNWYFGLIVAIGQGLGAWLAARFAIQNENATVWIRRLLIVVVIMAIIKLFFGAYIMDMIMIQ